MWPTETTLKAKTCINNGALWTELVIYIRSNTQFHLGSLKYLRNAIYSFIFWDVQYIFSLYFTQAHYGYKLQTLSSIFLLQQEDSMSKATNKRRIYLSYSFSRMKIHDVKAEVWSLEQEAEGTHFKSTRLEQRSQFQTGMSF